MTPRPRVPSLPPPVVGTLVRLFARNALRAPGGWPVRRALLDAASYLNPPVRWVRRRSVRLAGMPAELVVARGGVASSGRNGVVLYLHGGGYCVGSRRTQRPVTAELAVRVAGEVWVPEYRLAPEHPCPAAVDDAVAAYRALLAQGWSSDEIVVSGDSAGGGLTLSMAVALRAAGLPLPRALLLFSPWADLTLGGESHQRNAENDAMLSPETSQQFVDAYRGDRPAGDPVCSPLFADLRGLPPTLIIAGGFELLTSEAEDLARRMRSAGVEVVHHEEPHMWHDYVVHPGVLEAADRAWELVEAFVGRVRASAAA